MSPLNTGAQVSRSPGVTPYRRQTPLAAARDLGGRLCAIGLRPPSSKPMTQKGAAVSTFALSRLGVVVAAFVAAVTFGVSSASAATSYSGQARPLSVSAFGAGVSIGDTGALPSRGGSQTASLTNLNVLGFATIGLLQGTTSGSGSQSTSQASLASVSVPIVG